MAPSGIPMRSRRDRSRLGRGVAIAFALAATMSVVLAISAPRATPVGASGTGAMLVTPGAQTAPQGTNVAVGIDADGVSALGAFEFTIQYDVSLLAFVTVGNGGFIGSTGRSTFCPPPIVDSLAGTVRFACATSGLLPPGPTGSGRLANLTFFTLAEGTSPLTFTQAEMADVFGDSFTTVGATGGSITIFGGTPPPTFTATATFTPTPTSAPIGTATPTPTGVVPPGACGPAIEIAVCFDPANVGASVNAPASIGVRVEDVSNLGAFEIITDFNPALLSPVNAAPGPFLGSSGRSVQCLAPVFGTGTVRLQCVTLGATPPGPSGSGTLLTLTFLPVGEGVANLTFSLATLLDPEANVIVAGFGDTGRITIGPELTPTPCAGPCPTATPTATATNTATPTATHTSTVTPTPTRTPTPCGGPCPTASPTTPATATPTIAPVTVRVAPLSQTVGAGETFAAGVEIDGAVNLGAFQVRLTFDPSILQKGAPVTGPFLGSSGRSVQCLTPILAANQVQYNCVTTGTTPPGANGSGVLVVFPFTALTTGTTTFTIGNVGLTTPEGVPIPAGTIIAGSVDVVIASTPTPCGGPCPTVTPTHTPTLSPTPSGIAVAVINPVQQIAPVGTIVEVTVDVSGVVDLGAYQFTMRFDDARLVVVDVVNGDFLASTGRSVFCPAPLNDNQHVRFGCASTGVDPGPSGAGTLARVRFQTIANGPADLRLMVLDLADPFADTIPRTILSNPDEIIVGTPPTATPTLSPTVTPTPTIVPTATPCAPSSDCDGFDDVVPLAHAGPANTNVAFDNCVGVVNPDQLNADGNYINLAPDKAFNDLTWPKSDASGDACDTDDDNDGLSDADEIAGTACGAFGPTNPLLRDSDGDRYLDGAECALGTDPNDPNSRPSITACGDTSDADGDGVILRNEFCFYGTDPNNANTDGDACADGEEVASVNADTTVNSIDLSQVAQAFGPYAIGAPAFRYNFDMNKDGTISAIDLSFVAQRFGPC